MKKLTYNEIFSERIKIDAAKTIQRHPVKVLLHNIRSLYNVGSMFRTCDSALVDELILCGYTPHPPRKEIEKTALGAVDTVPWRYAESALETVRELKAQGIKVFAVELTDEKRRFDDYSLEDFPVCLVMGNEISGVDDDIIAECDSSVEIPMYGVKHSLNVGVASGISIYGAVEKWRELAAL